MGVRYVRAFDDAFTVEGDGRTVIGRIVPYGETIDFYDMWTGEMKRERFVPGAFAKQSSPGAWSRVRLAHEHDDGFTNNLGYGRSIEDREDGAYATFRLYEPDAVKTREMIEHSHGGLSLEFEPRGREQTDADGVVVRDNVHVHRVGITPDPAYRGAKVLGVRESDVERAPTPLLDDVRAMLAELRRGAP